MGGFYRWGIVCEHYFQHLDGVLTRKLRIFTIFRHKNVTFYGKVNFLTSDGRNSSSIRVFVGGESIASNIFDAWIDSESKNLKILRFFCYKSVTL